MTTITKETKRGTAEIRVTVTDLVGLDDVRAYLGGIEIGQGYSQLKAPLLVDGIELVAACGKLGLTREEVERVKAALVTERSAWRLTPNGQRLAAEIDKVDRVADANERMLNAADINKWRDA